MSKRLHHKYLNMYGSKQRNQLQIDSTVFIFLTKLRIKPNSFQNSEHLPTKQRRSEMLQKHQKKSERKVIPKPDS